MKNETPVVKRLGSVPFWRGERRVREQLDEICRKAMEKAISALDGSR